MGSYSRDLPLHSSSPRHSSSHSLSSLPTTYPDRCSSFNNAALSPHETLIFIHLMKTGGTSLFRLLKQHYLEEEIFHYIPRKVGHKLDDLQHWPPDKKTNLKFVHGHAQFGFHKYLSQSSRYITMLREPVSRVVSLYYFTHHNPNRSLPESERCLTLKDYLDQPRPSFDNAQTRAIAGPIAENVKVGDCPTELLESAKKNLATFLMVGITERFDESVLLLRHLLQLSQLLYSRANENQQRPTLDELDPNDLKKINIYNQLDIELYHYANHLLTEKIEQVGDCFQAEYSLFRQVNRQFNELTLNLNQTKEQLNNTHQELQRVVDERDTLGQMFSVRVERKLKHIWQRLTCS